MSLQPIGQSFSPTVLKFLYMMYPYESLTAPTFGVHQIHNVPMALLFIHNESQIACSGHRFWTRALLFKYEMQLNESSLA